MTHFLEVRMKIREILKTNEGITLLCRTENNSGVDILIQ